MIGRVLAAVTLTVSTVTAVHAQSLGEVAKKAEEERAKTNEDQLKPVGTKPTNKASKAYTNKDLPTGATSVSGGGDMSDPESVVVEGITVTKKDKLYWTARVLPLREKHNRDLKLGTLALEHLVRVVDLYKIRPTALGKLEVEKAKQEADQWHDTIKADERANNDLKDAAVRFGFAIEGVQPIK